MLIVLIFFFSFQVCVKIDFCVVRRGKRFVSYYGFIHIPSSFTQLFTVQRRLDSNRNILICQRIRRYKQLQPNTMLMK